MTDEMFYYNSTTVFYAPSLHPPFLGGGELTLPERYPLYPGNTVAIRYL